MVKRTLISIPALALLFSVVYFNGLYAKIVVGLVGVMCVHEMMTVAGSCIRIIGYVYAALLYPAYELAGFTGMAMLLAFALMSMFIVLVVSGRDARDGLMSALPMFYPGLFLWFLIAITCVPDEGLVRMLMLIVFGSAAITDSFAYFCGRLFGRHKLAPAISPKKTVEGAVGGMVFGTCSVFLFGLFAQKAFGMNIYPGWYLALGFILSILTQFGDLSASIIKRKFGVKDYGKIMGEHGGAMDRLDSSLFICPVVYGFYLITAF